MSTDESASTGRLSRIGPSLKDRLPSARSWIALLVGLAVGIGAFILSSEETRVGVRSTNVTIDDKSGYFDEEELRSAIDEVAWGRSMRILIAVIPLSELPSSTPCSQDQANCLQPLYPSYFPTTRIDDNSVVLWLDPDREIAVLRMGVHHEFRDESFFETEYDIARLFTYRAASGELTPETISDGFQLMSDIEADVYSGRSWTDYVLALTAGGLAALLVGLILNAAQQNAAQRRQAHGFAKKSKSELRSIVDRVFDTYREASASLDEIELIRASGAGSYEQTLDLRVAQYKRRYVQLARTVFEVQHLDRDELIKTAHLPQLVTLDRLATIIRAAEAALRADERVLQTAADRRRTARKDITEALEDHPSIEHLRTALNAAAVLTEKTGHESLVRDLPGLAHDIEQVGGDTPQAALADLDDLARRFATIADPAFISYAAEHGTEFDRRSEIEDPFRHRTLELAGTQTITARNAKSKRGGSSSRRRSGRGRQRDVTAAQVKQKLEERLAAAKVEQDEGSLKVPVSPLVIMIAAALAIAAGGVYVWLNPVGEGTVIDADRSAVTIPETLVDSDVQKKSARSIPAGEDFNDLAFPGNVEVIDDAGIFEDPAALEEALALIPTPEAVDYLVLTSEEKLPEDEDGRVDERGLLTIFPEHFSPVGEAYVGVEPENTVVVWYTGSGRQVDFETSFGITMDPDYDGRAQARSAITNPYPSYELQTWDAFAGYSTGARGIGYDDSDATLESGSSNVTAAVMTALITFVILVVLLPQIIKPLVIRRRRRSWERELTTTMTALTLAHDALSLDMDMVDLEHPDYWAAERFRRWNTDYLDVLRLTVNAKETIMSLEAQLRLARTVREQAESLWRIRPILDLQPTWSQAWENESSALYAALDSRSPDAITTITELALKLADGTVTPVAALRTLDEIAQRHPDTARLRCLEASTSEGAEQPSDGEPTVLEDEHVSIFSSPLVVQSRSLAETPLFSLAPKDDIDIGIDGASAVGAGETVQEITREKETAKAFFSIDTSATRWLQSVGRSTVGSIFGLHEQSPSQITKTLFIYTGVGITALIGLQIVTMIIGDGRDVTSAQIERSEAPLSVVYVNDAGEELSEELIERIAETEMGMPVNLLIYSTAQECSYTTIENQLDLAVEAPLAVNDLYGRVRPNTSGVVLCLGDESAYVDHAMNIDIGENFKDTVFDYRFYGSEHTHEEWLTQWLDDPDRGYAFEQEVRYVKQHDEVIR